MLLTLLAKVVKFYVGSIVEDIRGFDFELVSRSTFDLKKYLGDFILTLLAIVISTSILGNRKKGSLRRSGRSFKRFHKSFKTSRSLGGTRFI